MIEHLVASLIALPILYGVARLAVWWFGRQIDRMIVRRDREMQAALDDFRATTRSHIQALEAKERQHGQP